MFHAIMNNYTITRMQMNNGWATAIMKMYVDLIMAEGNIIFFKMRYLS